MMSNPVPQHSANSAIPTAGPGCSRPGWATAQPASAESDMAAPTPTWQNGVKRLS